MIDEVLAGVRKTVNLDPTNPKPRAMLCELLAQQNKTSELLTELEQFTAGDYELYQLGSSLDDSGKLVVSAAAYRAAVRLNPDSAKAHCNLGFVLERQGDYAGAVAMCRRGHELGTKQPGWSYPATRWVENAERMAALAERLPALLKGDDQVKNVSERLTLAQLCYNTQRFAAAARFWTEALDTDPIIGDDRRAQHRYSAACSAALAAAGQGKDNPPPDDDAKARFRAQALEWLKAERDTWSKLLDSGDPQSRGQVAQTLQHWRVDPDLTGVRDPDALARLPEDERKTCRTFWDEVDTLRRKAQADRP